MSKKKNRNANISYQNLNNQVNKTKLCCSNEKKCFCSKEKINCWSNEKNNFNSNEENNCCLNEKKGSTNKQHNKSRVTIFGQLGRTANDNYTLKCAAKINDTPISTEYLPSLMKPNDEHYQHKFKPFASHAVQVNLRDSWNKLDKLIISSNDQAIQCNFEKLSLECNPQHSKHELNIVEKCNSPVVVISVYPRPDVKISTDKVSRRAKSVSRNYFKYTDGVDHLKNANEFKDKMHFQRQNKKSRSASPTSRKLKKKKTLDDNLNKEKSATSRNYNNAANSLNISNDSFNSGIMERKINETNTTEVKKALVDNFIKNIDSNKDNYDKYLVSVPKNKTSKITIDLNRDKEHYDVVLKKSNSNTDLSVRRILRTENRRNKPKDSKNIVSVENFLMLKDKNVNHNPSPTNAKNQIIKNKTLRPSHALSARDSIELNHSREKRSRHLITEKPNHKCYRKGCSGALKHYRGDSCSIEDPSKRDKEIKQLLGVLRNQNKERINNPKKFEAFVKSSKTIITSVNTTEWLYPSSPHVPKDHGDQNKELFDHIIQNDQRKFPNKNTLIIPRIEIDQMDEKHVKTLKSHSVYSKESQKKFKMISNFLRKQDTPCDYFTCKLLESQHLVLNHNYIIFQVHQPHRRRTNIITKKQFCKLKKSTANTILYNANLENLEKKYEMGQSIVSLGKVKMKRKFLKPMHFDQEIQTENNENNNYEKCIQTEMNNLQNKIRVDISPKNKKKIKNIDILLFKVDSERKIKQDKKTICPRSTVSAIELQNSRNAHLEQKIPKSYYDVKGDGIDLKTKNVLNDVRSLHFIFKGRKRSATPNLGTSIFSEDSNSSIAIDPGLKRSKIKLKKHFLRRFISCLIMRFQQNSRPNLEREQTCKLGTADTSIDSYQINTSLGAWDMSSALYDTSASFYTSHTIHSITKTKRGFFNSVRGFLTRQKT